MSQAKEIQLAVPQPDLGKVFGEIIELSAYKGTVKALKQHSPRVMEVEKPITVNEAAKDWFHLSVDRLQKKIKNGEYQGLAHGQGRNMRFFPSEIVKYIKSQ